MRRLLAYFALFAVVAGAVTLWRTHHGNPPQLPAAPMQHEPSLMLWAWETPEDLTTLDPHRAGVAFLAREVLLDADTLTVRPRRQPLRIAPGTWLMAVVRIETATSFTPHKDTARQTAQAIAAAAQLPNVRALQVDFDASASQYDLYADVLRDLRSDLPPGFPLSITALVSWCGPHSWLDALQSSSQITEAVPMFFRMGGPSATRATAPRSLSVIAEPLCSGSVGLATDEAWPTGIRPAQRVYLFRPGPWIQNDLARINSLGYEGLRGPLQSP